MDAVTAVSGSGPAYFALLAEAMIEAGLLLGLSREISTQLVVQTMLGTAQQMRDLKMHPVELREMVTSPGGTTIAAIRELEIAGVRAAFLNAIQAAMVRSRELASGELLGSAGPGMGVYENLGVRTIINASGTLTRVGGSRMAPEVLAAMAEAAASFVHIDELQARAGEVHRQGDRGRGRLRHERRLGRAHARRRRLRRRDGRRQDGSTAGRDRDEERGRRPARPPQLVRPRDPRRRRHVGRGRLPRLPGRGRHDALADRGGDHRSHRRRRLPDPRHAGHAEPARGRRDRACPRRPGHRRRRRGAPPAGEPAPVHRRGRRSRRLLRRQGDRRAAVERHPRRPRRPDRLGRPAASGHGRARADVEPALAARLRRDRRSAPPGTRPFAQGRTRGDRRTDHGARALRGRLRRRRRARVDRAAGHRRGHAGRDRWRRGHAPMPSRQADPRSLR